MNGTDNGKNLILIAPSLSQGGLERVCVKTARLLENDYRVTMVIFDEGDAVYDVSGIRLVNLHLPPANGFAGKILNVFRRARRLRQIRRDIHADISYSLGISANLANVLSGGEGLTLTGLRCQTDMESPKTVKLFCDRSDMVLSCSREIMRQLHADYRYDRTCYINNPLDTDTIRRQAEEAPDDMPFARETGTFLVAAMARDDYIKGLWHLVKAFSLLHQRNEHARLLILGAGDYARLKELCRELGIADAVAFPGVKTNPFPYVRAADLYVLSSNHEGFPNALLEAMALGKPVVAADCKTGPREIVLSDEEHGRLLREQPDGSSVKRIVEGAFGILVPDMSEQADYDAKNITAEDRTLFEAMRMIAEDEARRQRYALAASRRAADFTPAKYREELLKILENAKHAV